MIRDYEIKLINNKEILYLYIDFNSEFAKLNSKRKKRKLKKYIKDYIERHNIDFKGTTVAIIVSGMMVGTIIFNKPINKSLSLNSLNNNYIVSIFNNYDSSNELDIIEENKTIEEDKKIVINEEKEIKKENKVDYSYNVKENGINTTVIEESINIDRNNNSIEEVNKTEVKEVSNIYVNVYRSNGQVLTIELEDYLIGVVGAEMPASFNIEALKAQAILARTYTLKAIKNGKKLTDESSTQNYKSNVELESMWGNNYNTYYNKIKDAVLSTKGMYLSYNGEYIEAVYHSTSNGKTENSKYVWGNSFPYLVSVDSVYDSTNKNYLYSVNISLEELSKKLGQIVDKNTVYNIISRNESGRVDSIAIDNINYTGVELRTKLGLRSTDFDIEKIDNGIKIITRGYGHGVGMSQYGANGMANNGFDYKSILLHYYKGVTINYN